MKGGIILVGPGLTDPGERQGQAMGCHGGSVIGCRRLDEQGPFALVLPWALQIRLVVLNVAKRRELEESW